MANTYKYLQTDFKDDIINEETNDKRKYRMIQNEDGTVSFEDVTNYLQKGSLFGEVDINNANYQINRINQLGWYNRCITDFYSKAKLYNYSVSDVEYDERLGRLRRINIENVDIDEADRKYEWKIDLQPKKYYVLMLDFREYILEKNGFDSNHLMQLIQLTNTGTGIYPYMTMITYESVAAKNSYFMDFSIYNFSDKVLKNFDLRGFALIYQLETRLKEVNG